MDSNKHIELKVILQENGIIRLLDGKLIARLCDEYDFNKVVSRMKEGRKAMNWFTRLHWWFWTRVMRKREVSINEYKKSLEGSE